MAIRNYVRCILAFVFIFLNLSSTYANEHNQFDKVQEQLSQQTNICGNFKQIRHIALLSKPLVSTGYFYLSKERGLAWMQQTPFKSTLTLTHDEMTQQIESNPPMVMTKEKQPLLFSFTNIFLSLFKGDLSTIQRYFSIRFSGSLKQWQIELKPKASPINKVIVSMVVSGSDKVNKIIVNQVKNNRMEITFSNIKLNKAATTCLGQK